MAGLVLYSNNPSVGREARPEDDGRGRGGTAPNWSYSQVVGREMPGWRAGSALPRLVMDLAGSCGLFRPFLGEGVNSEGGSEGAREVRPSFAPVGALPREYAALHEDGVEVDSELRDEVSV